MCLLRGQASVVKAITDVALQAHLFTYNVNGTAQIAAAECLVAVLFKVVQLKNSAWEGS